MTSTCVTKFKSRLGLGLGIGVFRRVSPVGLAAESLKRPRVVERSKYPCEKKRPLAQFLLQQTYASQKGSYQKTADKLAVWPGLVFVKSASPKALGRPPAAPG
eukprot:2445465-Rhodomonas_salina.1